MPASLAVRILLNLLSLAHHPRALSFALDRTDQVLQRGALDLELLTGLALDPRWPARYLAARRLGDLSGAAAGPALALLVQLAADPERFVREGAAMGLATWLAAKGQVPPLLDEILQRPEHRRQRLVAIRAAIVAIRGPVPPAGWLERLLTRLAESGDVPVGTLVVRRELTPRFPQRAAALLTRWEMDPQAPVRRQAQLGQRELLRARADKASGTVPS